MDTTTAARTSGPGAGQILERLRHRRVAVGLLAAAVSLVLHLLAFRVAPDVTLYGYLRRQLKERQFPLRLREVELEPPRLKPDRRPTPYQPQTGAAQLTGDVQAEVLAFRRTTDDAQIEPRAVGGGTLIGELEAVHEPRPQERIAWEPRQEILSIRERVVKEELSVLPRRFTPDVARVSSGRDIVAPAELPERVTDVAAESVFTSSGEPEEFAWGGRVVGGRPGGGGAPREEPLQEGPRESLKEPPEVVTPYRPLERLLKAVVVTHHPLLEPNYGYCRIEIQRLGPEVLPVLPKDLLLVQDCSASITEQKLYFCRQGLLRALEQLGPQDRFNVVAFRDRTERCFAEWSPVTPQGLQQAREFIQGLRSTGNTDIYGSMRDLLGLPRQPGRPMIMTVVSDGVATVGLRDPSLIIEAFSQTNAGAVSVFTMGTYPGANAYLLDLLSYRNRGDTFVVRTGRWDLPDVIERRTREISRPVLWDLRFVFAQQSPCEALPRQTANLYLDRPLVLVARYPRQTERLIFQAIGRAGELACDMVFDLDLRQAPAGDKEIRTAWAWQKAYDLIGQHCRTRDPRILEELRRHGRAYGLRIPYWSELSD